MPSTVVHVAFGALVATALLREFDARALAVVCGFAALPDLDAILAIWVHGGHRAILHNLLVPTILGAFIYWDARRNESWLRGRFGERAPRVAGIGVIALVVGGILPDLMTNGVNLFYPIYDRFYTLDGKLLISTTRGLVQTFVEFGQGGGQTVGGTTANTYYYTGVNPTRGPETKRVERIFPIVRSGLQLVVVLTAIVAVVGRFREAKR